MERGVLVERPISPQLIVQNSAQLRLTKNDYMVDALAPGNSEAISAKRSVRPSAQRTSIATVRPSIQPSSRSRSLKAVTHWPAAEAVGPLRNPIVGSFPACCARALSGDAAAPPRNVMNARR